MLRKFLRISLVFVMVFSLLSLNAFASRAGHNEQIDEAKQNVGNNESVYEMIENSRADDEFFSIAAVSLSDDSKFIASISTVEELKGIASGGNYYLANDIDLSSSAWSALSINSNNNPTLHDPSGYVYDACEPDERIVGATATLQKLVDGEWKEWVDPGNIQENPQITDSEGRYGWYVEEGTYRVLVSKDNYINITDNGGIAIANMPDGSFNSEIPNGSQIIVLPPHFDVNIPLKRTEYNLTVNGGTGSGNKAWGSDITVTADTAPSGQRFKHFIATGLSESTYTTNPLTFTMPTNAVTLEAVYENIPNNSVNNRGNTGVRDSSKTPNDEADSKKDGEMLADSKSEQDNVSYNDVPADSWYYDAVLLVTRKGLFDGVAKNTFSPDTSMTRAMFLTVLARLHGVELSAYDESTFVDVKANTWYTGAVEWAREAGIVNGVGNNKFAPNDPITREEMAAIFFNYLKIMNITVPKNGSNQAFSDIDTASTWAQESIAYMRSVGIINGVSGNNYAPKAIATRANVAKMFENYFYLMDK